MPPPSQDRWRQVPVRTARQPKPNRHATSEPPALSETPVTAPLCVAGLLRSRAKIDRLNVDGETPIQAELRRCHTNCVAALIQAGADVNKRATRGLREPPLVTAVRLGRNKCVEMFVAAGADVNDVQGTCDSALHAAIAKDNVACIRLLAAAGADVDWCDAYRLTPLSSAVNEGRTNCVAALLEAGADVNNRSKWGETALHVLSRSYRPKLRCLPLLLAAGADVDARNRTGATPLALATAHSPMIVQALIRAGADVNAADDGGMTALFHALHAMNTDTVLALLSGGADVEHASIDGTTPMAFACVDAGCNALLRDLRKSCRDSWAR